MDNKSQIGIITARERIRIGKRRTQRFDIPEEERRVAHAQRTAWDTESILSNRGWCLWQCELLGNDVIAIVKDDNVQEVPGRYVTYTESELKQIFTRRMNRVTLRIIHEAKRCGMLQSRHLRHSFGNVEYRKESTSSNSNYGVNLALAL